MKKYFIFVFLLWSCKDHTPTTSNDAVAAKPVRLITLDPGHFHAALVQKSMYADIDSIVHVYAPAGADVQSHLDKVNAYNNREKDTSVQITCIETLMQSIPFTTEVDLITTLLGYV